MTKVSKSLGAPLVRIRVGEHSFRATFDKARAPRTCSAFQKLLPLEGKIVHARWSGEALWVPLGDLDIGVPPENATSYPAPGTLLWYSQALSECEILLPYGACRFASAAGQLAGNPFLIVTHGLDDLRKLGQTVLWQGARDVLFELYEP